MDSVVYVDPDESISCDKRTDTNPKGTFIHHENSTTSDPKDTVIRASLQSLGLMPCTAYCWLCR